MFLHINYQLQFSLTFFGFRLKNDLISNKVIATLSLKSSFLDTSVSHSTNENFTDDKPSTDLISI